MLHASHQHSEGRERTWPWRHDDCWDVEFASHINTDQPTATSEGEECEVCRSVSELYRDRANCADDLDGRDTDNATGHFINIHTELVGIDLERAFSEFLVENECSCERVLVSEVAHMECGIGEGSFLATVAVCSWSWIGTCARWSYLKVVALIDPDERTATGADRVNVERGQVDRKAFEGCIEVGKWLAIHDERSIK